MVILHVAAPGAIGGLERVVQMLARGTSRREHEVHIAAIVDEPGAADPFFSALAGTGVGTHRLVAPGRAYLRERAAVAELCRTLRPDIVHTHGYRPDVLDAPVARRFGIPVVTTVHGFLGGGWKDRAFEWLQRRTARRADAVVAVSRPLAEHLAATGVARERIHVVPNALCDAVPPLGRAEAREILGLTSEGFVVGWIGRLSREKGADVLLDALALTADLPIAASLLGEGGERPALELQACALAPGVIRWHGSVPDARRLMRAFDAIVISSRTEGSPVVLLEAMAAEVPVIATAVGGIPDIVSTEEALLVPSEDPRALANALRALHEDHRPARARARRARERLLREFRFEPWIERYEAIYASLRERAAAGSAT